MIYKKLWKLSLSLWTMTMKTKDSTFFNSLNSSISVSQTNLFLYIEIRQRVMRNDFKTEFLKFFENSWNSFSLWTMMMMKTKDSTFLTHSLSVIFKFYTRLKCLYRIEDREGYIIMRQFCFKCLKFKSLYSLSLSLTLLSLCFGFSKKKPKRFASVYCSFSVDNVCGTTVCKWRIISLN